MNEAYINRIKKWFEIIEEKMQAKDTSEQERLRIMYDLNHLVENIKNNEYGKKNIDHDGLIESIFSNDK